MLMKETFYTEVAYMSNSESIKNEEGIKVKLLSMETGLTEYENVKFIRINNKDSRLIIMKDYVPIIGAVNGNIQIELESSTKEINNIIGYYMNKHNQFILFIKKEG